MRWNSPALDVDLLKSSGVNVGTLIIWVNTKYLKHPEFIALRREERLLALELPYMKIAPIESLAASGKMLPGDGMDPIEQYSNCCQLLLKVGFDLTFRRSSYEAS